MENAAGVAPRIDIKSPARILCVSFFLGCVADYFFYNRSLGISFPIFVVLVLTALFGLGKLEGVTPRLRNMWLGVPLLFFAAMTALRADSLLTALNVCAVLMLMAYLAYFYADGHFASIGFMGHAEALILTIMAALTRALPLVAMSAGSRGIGKRGISRLLPVARGLLLATPFLLIFLALFTSADLVFARFVSGLFRLEYLSNMQELSWQIGLVLGATWLLAGGLAYALSRKETQSREELGTEMLRAGPLFRVGSTEVTTLMASISALFFAFCWVQITYLFGGATNISVEGHTYADYARRGFFELVVASVLAGALILGLRWLGSRETRRERMTFNILSTVLVNLVLVLLASAFLRMALYEDAYGYTHLRLYVHIFEIWLAITLLWLLVTMWAQKTRFGVGAFVAALGLLATLNLVNPDALIATQNIARWRATGKVDALFLTQLSDDAVPSLLEAMDVSPGYERALLQTSLLYLLQTMETNPNRLEWPSFHFAHAHAYEVLVEHRDILRR